VSGAEEHRAAVRGELGVAADALLFVYSGTMAAWQKPGESALLVKAVRQHRPDARLLFLTPDQDEARTAVAQTGLEGVLYRTAKAREVDRYLCAADYGLLLRDESMVNRVACPVKFGEYLACGVRPLLSPNVGDQSDLCATLGIGVVVGLGDLAAAAKQVAMDAARPGAIDAAGRAARRAWAAEHIAPDRIAARVAEFIDRVAAAR
jgi:glycosyltransferase involved in cell wall biosynthesis